MNIYLGKVLVRDQVSNAQSRGQECLRDTKKACLQAPFLAFINFNKPLLLEIDANKLGLGAVLSQRSSSCCVAVASALLI